MKPIQSAFHLSSQEMEARQSRLQSLLKTRAVKRFMKDYQADESFIDQNLGLFDDYVQRLKKCAGCKGLACCTQPVKGKVCKLERDESGFLQDRYVSCKYEKMEAAAMEHASRFVFSHMDQKDYLIHMDECLTEETKEDSVYLAAWREVCSVLEADEGIYLYGQPGVGKTWLLMAAANFHAQTGKSVAFVNVPRLIQDLKENMSNTLWREQLMRRLERADLLVLDDIGAENITRWSRSEVLFPLLDARLQKKKKTFFSSNYTLPELEEQYACTGEANARVAALRVSERIRALSKVTPLTGNSRRQ